MSSKYGNLFIVFKKYIYYSIIEVILKGSCFELEKSVFDMNILAPFEQ
jgi:hypothetical protein